MMVHDGTCTLVIVCIYYSTIIVIIFKFHHCHHHCCCCYYYCCCCYFFRQILSKLAQVCAEVGCSIDRVTNELLGGIRALCIPGTVYKACSTGFSHLTGKANVCYYQYSPFLTYAIINTLPF